MSDLQSWTDYIIRRGFFLSCTLLASALVLLVWAGARPITFPALRQYAEYFQFSAAVVLAASLFGGLFLEDILRRK